MRISSGALVAAKLLLTVVIVSLASQAPHFFEPAPSQTAALAPAAAAPDQAQAAQPGPVAIPVAAPGAAKPEFVVTAVLTLDRELEHGDYAWNAEGVPPGPLRIVVDIGGQTLYVYRGGIEIGRSVILYGADNKPTPLGTFAITEKDKDHVSNLYDAAMPYMLRLTNDGIAIHGSMVEYGSATNGCIGVPDEFAALLFAEAKLGDRVIIVKEAALAPLAYS